MKKPTTKRASGKSSTHPSIRIQDFFRPLKDNAFDSLFFTDYGQVFRLKKWDVDEGTRLFNDQTLSRLINIPKNQKIVAILSFRPLQDKYKYLYMCTRNGQVKKTRFSEYSSVRQTGQIAILLDVNDSVGWVNFTSGDDDLMIISRNGQSIRFKENEIKSSHRDTLGVRGIRLSQDDIVASSFLIKNHRPDKVLIVTEEGKGKLSPLSSWSRQLHGGTGIKAAQVTHKTGPVIYAQVVSKKINTLLLVTDNERLIKVGMRKVPTLQRQTQGNRLIRLRQNEKVKNAIAISTKESKAEFSFNNTYATTDNTGSAYNPHLRYEQLQRPNTILRLSRNNSIGVLGLPTRLENALRKGDIHRLGELYDYPEKKLYKIENLGAKSVEYILSIKSKLVFGNGSEESALQTQLEPQTPNLTPIQLIDVLIKRCGDSRHMEIIQRRYGLLNGEIETLEEIGESFNISRERVRQIQKKAMKRMQHPSNLSSKPIIHIIEQLLAKNDYLISDEEADRQIPMIFNKLPYDGSSLMDLFVDLGWVQRHRVGDVSFYSSTLLKIKLSVLMESIVKILRKNILPVTLNELLLETPLQQANTHQLISNVVLKCCKSDPRIEDGVNNKFTLYKNNRKLGKWIPSITKVLEDEGEPLHFTEISEKVNDLLASQNARLDQRRIHSLLIENSEFAHTGIKGTYGLTKWGIRKDSTFDLVKEFITNAGFPVHWEQIFHYVSKYKHTSETTLKALLYSKFERTENGLYTVKE